MALANAERIDGRRAKGDASRRLALSHAMTIALVDGLDGLSFGRVARDSGMAKSSLQILFGDRESLQLQTLNSSVQAFAENVADAVRKTPDRDAHPLRALCDAWFSISGNAACGGCLLTSSVAEFSARSGPISEAVRAAFGRWHSALRDAAARSIACGELSENTDLDQLVFEILALQGAANNRIDVADEAAADRAARGIRDRIAWASR